MLGRRSLPRTDAGDGEDSLLADHDVKAAASRSLRNESALLLDPLAIYRDVSGDDEPSNLREVYPCVPTDEVGADLNRHVSSTSIRLISWSMYHLAFLRSSSGLPFMAWRAMYLTAFPRQNPRFHASMTLMASYGLSAPP